ncbi:uncharacterized protein N7459_002267 [Penicillium hispanicum]|uniref:uncharacterized protein n=1 Tax=Penicillium hispanicum TaxID=1080232 RepID=UPI00253FB0DF|nr:uncharacterized protein N7459_002267 [Penicillium hispanicum]KAJ5591898.1 hypothetical protein N7459_002267 [Penicillium hispanicum]
MAEYNTSMSPRPDHAGNVMPYFFNGRVNCRNVMFYGSSTMMGILMNTNGVAVVAPDTDDGNAPGAVKGTLAPATVYLQSSMGE